MINCYKMIIFSVMNRDTIKQRTYTIEKYFSLSNFEGKKVAYFGTGDQIGYADNFQDAMGILEEKITELGSTTIGYWPTNGYDHNESKAEQDEGENAGNFVGLALDDDNQPDLTDERIKKWVAQLKTEFGI